MCPAGGATPLPAGVISGKDTMTSIRCRRFIIVVIFLLAPLLYAAERYDVPIGNSPSRGPAGAPVTVIEFLDFQ